MSERRPVGLTGARAWLGDPRRGPREGPREGVEPWGTDAPCGVDILREA